MVSLLNIRSTAGRSERNVLFSISNLVLAGFGSSRDQRRLIFTRLCQLGLPKQQTVWPKKSKKANFIWQFLIHSSILIMIGLSLGLGLRALIQLKLQVGL